MVSFPSRRMLHLVACLGCVLPWQAAARTSSHFLTAPDAAPGSRFGAALDAVDTTLVVGAPGAGGQGAVYLFAEAAGVWSYAATVTAADAGGGDEFGAAVALDGDTLLVGAPGRNGGTGAAYVFTRSAGVWSQRTMLLPDGAGSGWRAGASVDVAGDLAILGVPGAALDGRAESGAAVAFVGSGAAWSASGTAVDTSALQAGDQAGAAVATDGVTVVIGAPGRDRSATVVDAGVVFVAHRDGTTITPMTTLEGGYPDPTDAFGTAVDVRGDALAVGVPSGSYAADNSTITATGSVEMFGLSAGVWSPTARLSGSFTVGDTIGTSVRLADGRLVTGGPYADGPANVSGEAASLFVGFRAGTAWTKAADRLGAAVPEAQRVTTGLGAAVAITADTIAGGAPRTDGDTGRVYLFQSRPPVFDVPAAVAPTTPALLEKVSFDGSATDPDGDDVRLSWNFGDGAGATTAATTHAYRVSGPIDATLMADDGIAQASTVVRLEVAPPTAAVSNVTFVERFRESLEPTGGGGEEEDLTERARGGDGGGERELTSDGRLRLAGTLSLTADQLASLGPETRFRLALGRLVLDLALGNPGTFRPGATKAKIVRVEAASPEEHLPAVRYLTLALNWKSGVLVFRLNLITGRRFRLFESPVLGLELVGGASGPRSGTLAGAIAFGPATATFTRSYAGKVKTVRRDASPGRPSVFRSAVRITGKG